MGKHLQSVQTIPQTLKPTYVYNVGVEGHSSISNCRPKCMLIWNLSTNGSYCVSDLEIDVRHPSRRNCRLSTAIYLWFTLFSKNIALKKQCMLTGEIISALEKVSTVVYIRRLRPRQQQWLYEITVQGNDRLPMKNVLIFLSTSLLGITLSLAAAYVFSM